MLEITAYAKVNLFLEITGKLPNGYHTVDTVMQTVSLSDSINLELTSKDKGILIHTDIAGIPTDERNIAYKAAKKFIDATTIDCGVDIRLIKRIPSEAGMGGGSADGAAVLAGLNKMCGNVLSNDDLLTIASSIGADVPFCVNGGTQRLAGIGTDLVERLNTPELSLVIAKPMAGISTPIAYGYLDKIHDNFRDHKAVSSAEHLFSMRSNNSVGIARSLYNRFEEASVELCPESNELISFMRENSHGALLSGSGAAVFAIADGNTHARRLEQIIKDRFPDYFVTTAQTVSSGCVINE